MYRYGEKMDAVLTLSALVCLRFEWMWMASIMLFAFATSRGIRYGLRRCYREVIEDYPKEDCVEPKLYKRFFPYRRENPGKGLPKEIYVIGVGIYIGYWVYCGVSLIARIVGEKPLMWVVAFYFFLFLGFEQVLCIKMYVKAFKARYKVINRYNFRYFGRSVDEPYPKKIGNCEILEEYKKRGKRYVKVRVVDTDEIVKDVLVTESAGRGKRARHPLFEICNVKYIN